ncbi:XRE family transcriptional regulator [Streptomyces sp. NBC_01136]|uniref:helix-turn-helix domain-containing protein n=1 Tax=unclassified Streptomyces TaxID=2593676 RepID=UPI00324C34D6|nr:XRE family transcriptional regulator [Streptomyces sp. NBC_01136]
MGRREVEINPLAGPVEELAGALRDLRAASGLPTYRQMAARTHYSASVLSRAARGSQLPSLAVVKAFAEACGADPGPYEQRWRQARQALHADEPADEREATPARTRPVLEDTVPAASATSDTVPAPSAGRTAPTTGRWRSRRPFLVGTGIIALTTGCVAAAFAISSQQPGSATAPHGWQAANQHVTDQREPSGAHEDMDGDDPRARGCGADASTVTTVPLDLPGGERFGDLRLRRSNKCGTVWASAYYSNPSLYTVRLAAHRPADGAEVHSEWSNNTPPGSYGDMLSTASGCVWIESVVVTHKGTGPTARTPCLQ